MPHTRYSGRNHKFVFSFTGKYGGPVNINVASMTEEQKKQYYLGWQNNRFNQFVSDLIPLNRKLDDVREPE